jgi:hypothetical protein
MRTGDGNGLSWPLLAVPLPPVASRLFPASRTAWRCGGQVLTAQCRMPTGMPNPTHLLISESAVAGPAEGGGAHPASSAGPWRSRPPGGRPPEAASPLPGSDPARSATPFLRFPVSPGFQQVTSHPARFQPAAPRRGVRFLHCFAFIQVKGTTGPRKEDGDEIHSLRLLSGARKGVRPTRRRQSFQLQVRAGSQKQNTEGDRP